MVAELHSADSSSRGIAVGGHLEQGQACFRRQAWEQAYRSLSLADREAQLDAEPLELLAMAAYLIGNDDAYLNALERAHQAHLNDGNCIRAANCAFWTGFRLLFRGETGRATGWLARAERLLENEARECAEQGYLLLPVVEQLHDRGSHEAAFAAAAKALAIGERCGDRDLIACARHQQGRLRLQQGQVEAGLALLDETMVAVMAGELSPLVMGLMYCSVIEACQQIYALDRVREWTAALAQWCDEQPEMVAFAGICQVHRAEIMQLHGAWPEAIDQAGRARACPKGMSQQTVAAAYYQQAEVHRLRGEVAAAEAAYRQASELGLEPQPGLALLRLMQGRADAAAAASHRTLGATINPLQRARLLPAHIEIMLAIGAIDEARGACRELEGTAGSFATAALVAMAAQARGLIDLAGGDARLALNALRCAFETWQRLGTPHAAARARVSIGAACRALGDEDSAALEFAAARTVFARLGAAPDLAQIDRLTKAAQPSSHHGLTARELQVLRKVATGETNKVIAAALGLSERTVDRHVSNILNKLDAPTRAAATAFACQHKLV